MFVALGDIRNTQHPPSLKRVVRTVARIFTIHDNSPHIHSIIPYDTRITESFRDPASATRTLISNACLISLTWPIDTRGTIVGSCTIERICPQQTRLSRRTRQKQRHHQSERRRISPQAPRLRQQPWRKHRRWRRRWRGSTSPSLRASRRT